MNIEILHEDNDILVCHKPPGIAVQSNSVTSPDMETMLRSQILRSGTFKDKSTLLHVIHRLDQPVEGIIVFGRNKKAAASLSSQVQSGGDMNKTYLAVVCGEFSEDEKEGELVDYIYKDTSTKSAVVISAPDKSKGAKKSTLLYKVLSAKSIEDKTVSLVEITLKSGRYHQIRAQFSNAGHPLLGDRRYNTPESEEISKTLQVRNVALCAYRLSLLHPATKKEMNFEIKPQGEIFSKF